MDYLTFGIIITVYSILIIFIIMILKRTPALQFLKASFGDRMIIINPAGNKYVSFEVAKKKGSMSFVKGKGYYVISPRDVYIEKQSKIPCAIAYGNFAISLNTQMVKLTEKLKSVGIKNYMDIVHAVEGIGKENAELAKKGKKPNKIELALLGESIPFDEVVDYFGRNERADYIEAEIQRRTASQALNKVGMGGSDVMRWLIIFGVFIIIVALAYKILGSGGGMDLSQFEAMAQRIGATGTSLG